MLELKTPRGLLARVPEDSAEDPSPGFTLGGDDFDAIRSYYKENGYVVLRSLLAQEVCDTIRQLWNEEVKPCNSHIYRQANARAERHAFNENGWVMNPILNLQSVDPRHFPKFRQFATEQVLAAPPLAKIFHLLLGESPKIVQSMYFEGNSATWEHQDTYYLDSEHVGEMVAAWIAIEDIDADAGRFFVCPGSHLIDMGGQSADNNIADHHEDYIQSVVSEIKARKLDIRCPRMQKGDVLFWNSRTIHGSLDSQSSRHSRSSVTCHAIAQSHRFLQLQTKVIDISTRRVSDTLLYQPKDLALLKNRVVFWFESQFPAPFYRAKRLALRARFRWHRK